MNTMTYVIWIACLILMTAIANAAEKGGRAINFNPRPPAPSAQESESVRDLGVTSSICQAGNANYAIHGEADKSRCVEAGGTVRPHGKDVRIEVKPLDILTDNQKKLNEMGKMQERNRPELQKSIHFNPTDN